MLQEEGDKETAFALNPPHLLGLGTLTTARAVLSYRKTS